MDIISPITFFEVAKSILLVLILLISLTDGIAQINIIKKLIYHVSTAVHNIALYLKSFAINSVVRLLAISSIPIHAHVHRWKRSLQAYLYEANYVYY